MIPRACSIQLFSKSFESVILAEFRAKISTKIGNFPLIYNHLALNYRGNSFIDMAPYYLLVFCKPVSKELSLPIEKLLNVHPVSSVVKQQVFSYYMLCYVCFIYKTSCASCLLTLRGARRYI